MDEGNSCRICYSGGEAGELIRPCSCHGSIQWVHAECLEEWWRQRASSSNSNVDFSAEGLRCDICGESLAVEQCDQQLSQPKRLCLGLKAICTFLCQDMWCRLGTALSDEFNFLFEITPVAVREILPVVPITSLTAWWLISEVNRDSDLPSWCKSLLDMGLWLLPLLLWYYVAMLSISFPSTGIPSPLCPQFALQKDIGRAHKQLLAFVFSNFIVLFFSFWPRITSDYIFDAIPLWDAGSCLLPVAAFLLIQTARRCVRVNFMLDHRTQDDAENYVRPHALPLEVHVLCVAAILVLSLTICMLEGLQMATGDYFLHIELYVGMSIGVAMEFVHSLLILQILCTDMCMDPVDEVLSRIWARIGLAVSFHISLLALAACSVNSFWKYLGLLVPWGFLVLRLCGWLGAPVRDEARAWLIACSSSVKSTCALWHWKMWLQSRRVRFTNQSRYDAAKEPFISIPEAD